MQRYRVNYRLLATLAITVVLAAPALYFLWSFQVNRNASRLLEQADLAENEGNYQEAYECLYQYCKLRPDENDARLRLGRATVKVSEQPGLDMATRSEAYFALVDAVQRTGDNELRRDLVDLHVAYGYMDRALQAINELIDNGVDDPELLALKAQGLFGTQNTGEAVSWSYKLIGYDRQKDAFDVDAALAPKEPRVYAMLAQYLIGNRQPELAERVIAQMVLTNPDSKDASLFQYQLLKGLHKQEDARIALEKAYEIDPADAMVLLYKGIEAISDYQDASAEATAAGSDELREDAEKHLDEATELFTEGLQKFPDMIAFYEHSARIELFRSEFEKALAIVEKGLKRFDLRSKVNTVGLPLAIELEIQKVDIYFAQNRLNDVKAEIKALRALQNPRVAPLADYYEAQIELRNQNWLEAARRFNEVKSRLIGFPPLQAMASASQALCHSQLGQYDLARAAYIWALEKNPNLSMAKQGKEEIDRMFGQASDEDPVMEFDKLVKAELDKPAAEQDWTRVEELIEEYIQSQAERRQASQTWIDSRRELLRAQMLANRASQADDPSAKQRLFAEARQAAERAFALDPDDIAIQLALPRLVGAQPENGPAEALAMLDDIIAKNKGKGVEESAPFRLLRIDLLFALQDEQLPNQLHAATEGMQNWPAPAQAQVWAAVAARFDQLSRFEDAQLCWEKAIALLPTQLTYRVALFELARKQTDNEAMVAAQQGILELLKSKSDPDYVLTEVKRLMVNFATGAITKDEFARARTMLDAAIKQRPTWADLYVLSGQLYMVLEQDAARALASFDRALANGPANLNALNLQVRLLAELGRFVEAREKMNRIPSAAWSALLNRTAAMVLQQVGEKEKAASEAKRLAEASPNDPSLQVWYAGIAADAEDYAAAEAALKRAVDMAPGEPDNWSALLNFYMLRQRAADVESTLRQSQLALDEEYLTVLTAQQQRLFGKFVQAEAILMSAYSDRMKELSVAHRVGEFYLQWAEQADAYRKQAIERGLPTSQLPPDGSEARGKAAPHINRLLRAVNEGKLQPTDPLAAWARRQAAYIFSLTSDYQDSLKAEKLLTAAVESNVATAQGQELLIDILNRRGDPASRERTVALLKEIARQRGVPANYELQLGQALFDVGRWEECQRHMEDAISRHPGNLALRVGYVEMLIARKEADLAERWLGRMRDIAGAAAAIPQLQVRLAVARGDMAEVRRMLQAMTPDLRVLNEQQLKVVHAVAALANSVGDHEYALRLITEYSRRVPGNDYELAQFTAMYGDLETGVDMLKKVFPDNMDDVLSTAVEVLRTRRLENPALLDEELNRMVGLALRDDPEAARRMVSEAEVFEIQEKFDDAVAAYQKILKRDDVPKFVRAMVLNNLAFVLAIQKQDLDLALESVNDAIDIIGPISDILDTRALVYYHRGEFAKAIEDLRLAVKINPTPSKYFHLAAALLGAGDRPAALEAWKEAESRGIAPNRVSAAERDELELIKQRIDAARGGA